MTWLFNNNMSCPWLFVYGTLRKGCKSPLSDFMQEHCQWHGAATIQGLLYDLGTYPGLIESRQTVHQVKGELFAMKNAQHVLSVLDEYEECSAHFPVPHEYQRVQRTVRLNNRETTIAWVYLFNHSCVSLPLIKSGDYLQYLQAVRTAQTR